MWRSHGFVFLPLFCLALQGRTEKQDATDLVAFLLSFYFIMFYWHKPKLAPAALH
jgi:hypothetical protein